MKKFPFILNGEDFTDLTNKYGYITDRVPVYSSQWTDLSGVKHRTKIRDRGYLSIQLNDIEADRSLTLCTELLKQDLQVEYYSFQLGRNVTEKMHLESMPRSLLMVDGSVAIHEAVILEFSQA